MHRDDFDVLKRPEIRGRVRVNDRGPVHLASRVPSSALSMGEPLHEIAPTAWA